MQSSSGAYYPKLDHVRALGAYLVFTWHAIHARSGAPVSFDYVPDFFLLSLLEEGHLGVSVFITLTGYLMAKLLRDTEVDYLAFFRNRALRLLPLLAASLTLFYAVLIASGAPLGAQEIATTLFLGLVLPVLPLGGWSLTIEFHLYCVLPLLRRALSRWGVVALGLVALMLLLRLALTQLMPAQAQHFGYWTVLGKFDHFLLGMYFQTIASRLKGRHLLALIAVLALGGAYHAFNVSGGFMGAPALAWAVLPTIEGLCLACLVAYYDETPLFEHGRLSRAIAWIGTVSYSIYLLHFTFVYSIFDVLGIGGIGFGAAVLISTAAFILFVPVASLSYRTIEAPFLRFRQPYRRPRPSYEPAETGRVPPAGTAPAGPTSGA